MLSRLLMRSRMASYGIALLAALGALLLRLALSPLLHDRAPIQLFLLAVVVSGCFGGLGPALFCTALCGVLGQTIFISPGHFQFAPGDLPRLILYALNGTAISVITEFMRRSIRREHEQAEALRQSALERQESTAMLDLRERRFNLLSRLSNQLITATQPRALLGETFAQLASELHVELYVNFLATPDGFGLELANQHGFSDPEAVMLSRFASGNSLSAVAAQRREPLVVDDLETCPLPEAEYVRSLGVKIYACHPLIAGGRLIGTLSFASRRRPPFREHELVFLRTACDQVAAVLERTRLAEERAASQHRLQTALKAGGMGTWELDLATKALLCSEGCKANFGRPLHEPFTYDQLTAAIHAEDRERWEKVVTQASTNVSDFEVEYRALGRDGATRVITFRGTAIVNSAGRTKRLAGISMDVTAQRRSEQVVAESEARWHELAEAMPQLVWTCNANGECDFLSQQWVDYTGLPAAAQLGTRWVEQVHPDDRVQIAVAWNHASSTGCIFDTEFRIRRQDGVYRWFKTRATATRDRYGRIVKWIGSNTDIEDLKHAEFSVREREEQLRLITDHAPVFLAEIDCEHRYRFANRPYAARYGYQSDQVIGRHVSEIVGERAYAAARPYIERACSGQQVEFEVEIPYDRLGPRWAHAVFVPYRDRDGLLIGFLSVLTDVTLRKRNELELQHARDEALAASQAKDAFLSTLSHELRTPLNPVLLLASDAARNPALPAEVRSDFESIFKNVSLEARLIDDLLDLTRISRGKVALNLQPLDIHALLRDACTIVQADLDGQKQRVHFDLQASASTVQGDSTRLQQIFWNLLRNAVKFTPKNGIIYVRTANSTAGDRLVIEVADSGIGLQPEEIARIFEAFAQGNHAASGASTTYGGLGLGLAICKLLAELHEGRISARSDGQDRGATFTVDLPVPRHGAAIERPVTPISAAPAIERSSGKLRILLVEDHESTRAALAKLLGRRGHQVTLAATGSDAMALAREQSFDIVICDLGLPDISGHALMSELRSAHGLSGIALSGYGSAEDMERSLECGFFKHLTKPVDIALLAQTLEELPAPPRP